MVPCSIWIPPAASGPVFTVSRPILTGLPCALAERGSVAAASAVPVPITNLRRSRCPVIGLHLLEARSCGLGLASYVERRGLLGRPPSHRHVTELIPQAVDLRQHRLVRLLDVDRS